MRRPRSRWTPTGTCSPTSCRTSPSAWTRCARGRSPSESRPQRDPAATRWCSRWPAVQVSDLAGRCRRRGSNPHVLADPTLLRRGCLPVAALRRFVRRTLRYVIVARGGEGAALLRPTAGVPPGDREEQQHGDRVADRVHPALDLLPLAAEGEADRGQGEGPGQGA